MAWNYLDLADFLLIAEAVLDLPAEQLRGGATGLGSADAARRGHVLRHRHPGVARMRFGPEDAARIECPVLYIGGSESGPWFAEVHDLILAWIPHAENVILDGADHSLPLTYAPQIADTLHAFLERTPT